MFFKKKKEEEVYENNTANPSDEEEKTNGETVEDADKVTVEDSEDKTVNGVEKIKTKTSDISLFGIGFLIFAGTTAVCFVLNSISKILSAKSK